MSNKQTRIAEKLQRMATNFRNIAVTMEETIKILLEKDTVTAEIKPLYNEKGESTLKGIYPNTGRPLSDNAGRGNWGAAIAASNRGETWKDDMTAEINENNRKAIATVAAASAKSFKENIKTPVVGDAKRYDFIYAQTTDLTLIRCSPRRSRYYKINNGVSKGCVIQVNDKTSKLVKDGRYNGISVDWAQGRWTYVATVTCDNDGKDYVNRVIRPLLTKNQKVVRMYRPKGHAGHFTHCDVYVTKRHWNMP